LEKEEKTMQRLSFGAALAALGIIILATAIPAAAGTEEVAPLFGGNGLLRSAPAAPCGSAKALNLQTTPERRSAWWPDLCGACSSAPTCVGLLVLDVRSCDTEDGGKGICRSDGWESCTDTDPDDNRDEVSCYCSDW
jgi:hypothetical protein